MLRCQFLCHVLIALFLINVALKLRYFCKKIPNFRALGAQTPKTIPPLRISGNPPGCAFERRSPLEFGEKSAPVLVKNLFFWSLPELGEKSVPFLAKPFFWSSLNLLN